MKSKGFTLVELIVVMVVMGVLAVIAVPRFADQSAFEARGFHDETLALLRFAQKSAIAQRRNVCVSLEAAGVKLEIASSPGSAAACNTALTLANTPRGGTGLSAKDASNNPVGGFSFKPDGGTNLATDISVSITGSIDTITVDKVTGYVF
ncbi:MAG: methylation [Proteobacteria bacterium]|nr:methylation [Pseudomonadota bacterium]